jgi:hypothetical protein
MLSYPRMYMINFILGIITGNRLAIELAEILCLAAMLVVNWKSETRLTKIGFPLIIAVLSADVLLLHCERPIWVCGIFNIPSVFGWFWLYEKIKRILREVAIEVLAFFTALLM